MSITSFWRPVAQQPTEIRASSTPGGDTIMALPPQDMTLAKFEQMETWQQVSWVDQWRSGTNKSVTIRKAADAAGNASGPTIRLTVGEDRRSVTGTLSEGVLDPTRGELLPDEQRRPYHELPGAPGGGALSKAGADALFPKLDGIQATIAGPKPDGWRTKEQGLPAGNDIPAFLAKFTNWHSAHQAEFIRTHGTLHGTAPNQMHSLQLTSGGQSYVAALSLATGRIYHVGSLSKQDVAVIPTAELATLNTIPGFTERRIQLGLSEIGSANSIIDAAIAHITLPVGSQSSSVLPNGITHAQAPEYFSRPFLNQINNLRDRLSDSLVDINHLKSEIDKVRGRFDRFNEYYKSVFLHFESFGEYQTSGATVRKFVNSLDEGTSIIKGLTVLFEKEQSIADSALRRQRLVGEAGAVHHSPTARNLPSSGNGKSIDLPTLIYLLQKEYSIQKEAEVASDTEIVNQMNELLKSYTLFQSMVNHTIGSFTKDENEKQTPKGINKRDGSMKDDLIETKKDSRGETIEKSEQEKRSARVLMMFDENYPNGHPMEHISKNYRPYVHMHHQSDNDILALKHTPSGWQQYQTTLSERVNSLNQDSQVRMNEINNKDKERNRHFDQANNALQKLNEALQSILRAG